MQSSRRSLFGLIAISLLLSHFWPGRADAHSIADNGGAQTSPELRRLPPELAEMEEARPDAGLAVRGVLQSFSLWPIESILTVCFLDGDSRYKQLFVDAAKEWTQYASLTIAFGNGPTYLSCSEKPDASIRVSFSGTDSWSLVGTDSTRTDIPSTRPTLNIGIDNRGTLGEADLKRLVSTMLHEIGHALGLEHEHQSPQSKCQDELNWSLIYGKFVKPPDITRSVVEHNFVRLVASPRLIQTDYDRQSIMHYSLAPDLFKNGSAASCYVPQNLELSRVDKQLIALVYPKTEEERDAFLRKSVTLASAALAPTPMSSGELASFAGEMTKIYGALQTKVALNFDFSFVTNARDSGDVASENCSEIISSSSPASGVRCKIALDASYLSIGGD